MDKLFQVFVSSTYDDLKNEREAILRVLLENDYLPVGMELWSAASTTPLDLVRSVLDNCDYMVLIVAGCYGSRCREDKSYTELEYEYAFKKRIPILAFSHERPEDLPDDKKERSRAAAHRLEKFRAHILKNVVAKWTDTNSLVREVLTALNRERIDNPRGGWIRNNANPPRIKELRDTAALASLVLHGVKQSYWRVLKEVLPRQRDGFLQCPDVRVNIMALDDRRRYLRILFTDDHEVYNKRELEDVWKCGEGKCGAAWESGRQEIYVHGSRAKKQRPRPMTGHKKPRYRKLQSVISTPIVSATQKHFCGVLNLDSKADAFVTRFSHDSVRGLLRALAQDVEPLLPPQGVNWSNL